MTSTSSLGAEAGVNRPSRFSTTKYRIKSPPTGELFEFAASARSAEDGKFRFVWTLAPGKRGPSEHFHDDETETFEVVSGTLRMWVDDVQHDLHRGDVLVVKPNARHRFLNPGKEPAVVNVSFDGPRMEDTLVPVSVARDGLSPRIIDILRMTVAMGEQRASIPSKRWERGIITGVVSALVFLGVKSFPIVRGWDCENVPAKAETNDGKPLARQGV